MKKLIAAFCLSIVFLFGSMSVSWGKKSLPRDIAGFFLLSNIEDAKRSTKSCKDPERELFMKSVYTIQCVLENDDKVAFQTKEGNASIIAIQLVLKMEIDIATKMIEEKYGASNGKLPSGFDDTHIPTWEDDKTRLFLLDLSLFAFGSPMVLLVLQDKKADFKIRNKDTKKLKSILDKLP